MLKNKNLSKKTTVDNPNVAQDSSTTIEKYSKPNICFFDFKKSDSALIDEIGFKIYEGSLGSLVSMKNEYGRGHYCLPNYEYPQNLHEYDILLFDLNNQSEIEYRAEDHVKKEVSTSKNHYFYCKHPKTVFNPAPYAGHCIAPIISKLSSRDSIIVVFANAREIAEYEIASTESGHPIVEEKFELNNYSFLQNDGIRFLENKYGNFINTIPNTPPFDSFLKKYINNMEYKATFYHPTKWVNNKRINSDSFMPLLLNNDEDIISYVELCNKQLIIVFPELECKGLFLKELLESILPDIMPQLFPDHQKGAWTKNKEYFLPNESDLFLEKEVLKKKYKDELHEIDIRIAQNKEKYSFLHKILMETGHELVKSIITFLEWLDFKAVEDADDTGNTKEEDIRIEIDGGILIIEAKGISGTSKDDDCAQISKIRSRRCEQRKTFDVYALYIVNHQRHLPPLDRTNPPFSKEQVDDAELNKRGLITTWELFNLFMNIELGVISKEQARRDLLKVGLIEFIPDKVKVLGTVNKTFQQGKIIILNELFHPVSKGQTLYFENNSRFIKIEAINLQINGKDVETATPQDEVGIEINHRLKVGDTLYISIE